MDDQPRRRLSRRDVFQLAAGSALGVLGTLLFTEQASGGQVGTMDVCQWVRVGGPVCSRQGELIEYWAYRCCYGQRCDYYKISERVIGSC